MYYGALTYKSFMLMNSVVCNYFSGYVVFLQRLIREEWESIQQREKEEENRRKMARREKEVITPFILTNILIQLTLYM